MLPIYYINLDRRTDRRALTERQLGHLKLSAQRVSAMTVAAIPPKDLERHCNPKNVKVLSRSQLACAMSHLLTWRMFLESGADWALILEDDVLISDQTPAFLTGFGESQASQRFDLVHLEATARRARVLPAVATIGRTKLRPFCSTQWGAASYLISARAARALVGRDDPLDAPVDQVLFRPYAEPGRDLRMALADPALFVQINKTESTDLARGNLTPVRAPVPASLPLRLRRFWHTLPPFLSSVAYHLRHLPKGVTSEVIAFDTPEQRYVGSKLKGYGREIVD